MLIAVDIGNTRTAIGLFHGDRLAAECRIGTPGPDGGEAITSALEEIRGKAGTGGGDIRTIGVSSVVPSAAAGLEGVCGRLFGVRPLFIHADMELGIAIRYTPRAALGPDRLCNAVAGFSRFGGPLIVVDLGTAITFDVVDADGSFLGGAIAPGPWSAAAALHGKTALLPEVELRMPDQAIGRSTEEGMRAGIVFGCADAVDGMIRRIRRELGTEARAVATGGLARLVTPLVPAVETCVPSLVLDGIRIICSRVTRRGPPPSGKADEPGR
ncbi:MAG: type III pantothenate kinase [Bacteroidota bacterium]